MVQNISYLSECPIGARVHFLPPENSRAESDLEKQVFYKERQFTVAGQVTLGERHGVILFDNSDEKPLENIRWVPRIYWYFFDMENKTLSTDDEIPSIFLENLQIEVENVEGSLANETLSKLFDGLKRLINYQNL